MSQFFSDCPHCLGTNVGMNILAKGLTREQRGIIYAQCNRCTMPVTSMVQINQITPQQWIGHNADMVDGQTIRVMNVFPPKLNTAAPDHVEAGLSKIFIQAEDARRRQEYHTAGMGLRKTLDIALKVFDPNLKGDLYSRIDALEARHDITPAMKSWAHQVRLIGNEAAHEAVEPSKEDIDAMASFTETLLKYLFTLPAEVKARSAPNP